MSASPFSKTLADLAALTGATLVGNGDLLISGLAHPRWIESPESLVVAIEPEILSDLLQQKHPAKAALIAESLKVPDGAFEGYLVVSRPRHALAILMTLFDTPLYHTPSIHPTAVVADSAQVHPSVSLGAFVWVGPKAVLGENTIVLPHATIGAAAQIGENSVIHPGVRIGERVVIGDRVILHPNCSIGADGFSYVTPEKGSVEAAKASGAARHVEAQNTTIVKIPSLGTVILEDDVEVGACATIDRSNLGATVIKKGTKIDNLVMIGHNNTVGENCLIAGQAGISGSCRIEDRVVIAGQAGIADHLKIGEDAIVTAQAGVMRDVSPKTVVAGMPALEGRQLFENTANLGRIKKMRQEIKDLHSRLEILETALAEQAKPPSGAGV